MSTSGSAGFRSVRDRSPTPYPHGLLDPSSGSDSDPSEEYMLVDVDSEDSSVQMFVPTHPPVIDLVHSPDSSVEIVDSPVPVIDLVTPSPETQTETDQIVQTPVSAMTTDATLLITPEMFIFETPVPDLPDPIEDGQLSPIRTETVPSSAVRFSRVGTPTRVTALPDLVTIPAPIYASTPPVPTVPDYMFPAVGTTPVCDTAPPTPTLQVSAPPASSVVTTTAIPPVPPEFAGVAGEMVPWHIHHTLFQHYRWLWARYEEIFTTRDGILRLLAIPDPAAVHQGGSLLVRDVPMEIVHEISLSVLTGLQTDIAALPSSSTGQIDQSRVATLIAAALAEFRRRVGEMFGQG